MDKVSYTEQIDQVFTDAKQQGIFQLTASDHQLDGRLIHVDQRPLINFGSCSYLGLEKHPFLVEGAIKATQDFGTQFSSSRAYMSCPLYEQLEELLGHISGYHALVCATTTLAHLSAIPTLVEQHDVVILDHQVHASVQTAVRQIKARNGSVDMIRHNDLEMLEKKLIKYRDFKERIWYCIDGVYSMYGDFAPFAQLLELQKKYPQLHLYIDDAHGFSWYGLNGKGVALSEITLNDRIVIAASLNKSFASAGGVLFFSNAEQKRKVKTCGGSLIFSGPIQPPMLGAAIRSAQFHLSDELPKYQQRLQTLVTYCNAQLKRYDLPNISNPIGPIFFIAIGNLHCGYALVEKMIQRGCYTNIALFPAVPIHNTGVRFTLSLHLSKENIDTLCLGLASDYQQCLHLFDYNAHKLARAFRLSDTQFDFLQTSPATLISSSPLSLKMVHSIKQINQSDWNQQFQDNALMQSDYLLSLERTFKCEQTISPQHWQFFYVQIKDNTSKKCVLSAFFTKSVIKDDMFLSKAVSAKVAEYRKQDASQFSSPVLMLGSVLSQGQHLAVDDNHPLLQLGLTKLLQWVEQQESDVDAVILRDFNSVSSLLEQQLRTHGFIKQQTLSDHRVLWQEIPDSVAQWQSQLKPKFRYFHRRWIARYSDHCCQRVIKQADENRLDEYYQLYKQVHAQAEEITTYCLPRALFSQLNILPNLEIIELWLKKGIEPDYLDEKLLVGVVFCIKEENNYTGLLAGIDYQYQHHQIYRQVLYAIVEQARMNKIKMVHLGFGASLEKKRVGATSVNNFSYVKQKNLFSVEAMQEISAIEKV